MGYLIALERVRIRIATDLHDDIGSGLARIGILSEVLKGSGVGRDVEEQRNRKLETRFQGSNTLVNSPPATDFVHQINDSYLSVLYNFN